MADLREAKAAASLEPAEIAFGGPFIARGYLGRWGFSPSVETVETSVLLQGELGVMMGL